MTLPNSLLGVDVGDDGTYRDVSHDVVTKKSVVEGWDVEGGS